MRFTSIRRGLLVPAAALLLLGATSIGIGIGSDAGTGTMRSALEPIRAHASPHLLGQSPGTSSIADMVEEVLPSVVNISTTKATRGRGPAHFDPFFQDPRSPFRGQRPGRRHASSLGSGVIVSASGHVLTNSHVIADSDDIRVALADGRELEARVVGSDPKSDLAVLQLVGDVGTLTPIRIGRSSAMRLGEVVLAIGNPFGVGQAVTMGIISAKGRSGMGIVDYEDFIQTDAAINPGNSGGALVNTKGELIGINTAILSRTGGYQGIGLAIPTDMAKPIMDSLMRNGKVERGWLGVRIQTLTSELAEAASVPGVRGVLVSEVVPDSPAARAGLHRGDVITHVAGKAIHTAAHLSNAVAMAGANETVALDLLRDGTKRSLRVELGDLARAAN